MSERIALRGIRALGRHGVFPLEQQLAQPFDIDVELDADVSCARSSDALEDTLDNAALLGTIVRIVAGTSYRLLERLGDEIASALLADPRVAAARVTIAKPRLLHGATPSVTVESKRSGRDEFSR